MSKEKIELTEIAEKIMQLIGSVENQHLESIDLSKGLSLLIGLDRSQLRCCQVIVEKTGHWNDAARELFYEAEGLLKEIVAESNPKEIPGHPLHTLYKENKAVLRLVEEQLEPRIKQLGTEDTPQLRKSILESVRVLNQIEAHFLRMENLIFPYLERAGFVAPTKVMWAMHDDARRMIRDLLDALENPESAPDEISHFAEYLMGLIKTAIRREEETILNNDKFVLTHSEWKTIAQESSEIGYCMIDPDIGWVPENNEVKGSKNPCEHIDFETGIVTLEQLVSIMDVLPMEMTFIDAEDTIRYFSKAGKRMFSRSKTELGRSFYNCHLPEGIRNIELLISDFKTGRKSRASFEVKYHEKVLKVVYYALRTQEGVYLGTLECVENKD